YYNNESLYLHRPQDRLSMAENFLYSVRHDNKFTQEEARLLDLCMVLHAEHGGGNNSAFACRVLSSSGTDIYSAIAAAVGSLKGPRHGGANKKVMEMFHYIQRHVKDWADDDEVRTYLSKLIHRRAGDRSGLIYGMGHAVYTLSDPREVILKRYARYLAEEKGLQKEFALYETVERIAGDLIMKKRKLFKPVCANVDFYSGFVYAMLNIPRELYTPIFAISRISGWSAHRMEELVNAGKIIRPAYRYVGHHRPYLQVEERKEESPFEAEYRKAHGLDA
ncbi:MAG: citrate synthase, partial [Clostridia bacterium]|nr:citrate synthase [Clostridia bacterium]